MIRLSCWTQCQFAKYRFVLLVGCTICFAPFSFQSRILLYSIRTGSRHKGRHDYTREFWHRPGCFRDGLPKIPKWETLFFTAIYTSDEEYLYRGQEIFDTVTYSPHTQYFTRLSFQECWFMCNSRWYSWIWKQIANLSFCVVNCLCSFSAHWNSLEF